MYYMYMYPIHKFLADHLGHTLTIGLSLALAWEGQCKVSSILYLLSSPVLLTGRMSFLGPVL
jgi:hypothetical protein